MKYVDKEVFFHIQREPTWDVGHEVIIGLRKNNLLLQLEDKKEITLNKPINQAQEEEFEQLKVHYSSFHMYKREIIFEDVRKEYFPEKPSRFNAMWLCDDGDNLEFWKNQLKNTGQILTVEVTGKIHHGCATNLSSGGAVQSRELYLNEAFKYWSGISNNKNSTEYLFIGHLKVIEARPI